MKAFSSKQYVLIVPDGAADLTTRAGKTPLELAVKPGMDYIARKGCMGRMRTLYDDLPKGSIVAQLGMLGYDPYLYYPHGRASLEAAPLGLTMGKDDLAFRANFVNFQGDILKSYNAGYIKSQNATRLVNNINDCLRDRFPDIKLYHNSDFRNVLLVRNAGVRPEDILCIEPHENEGKPLDKSQLLCSSVNGYTEELVFRINTFLMAAMDVLQGEQANGIVPWSVSGPASLPPFVEVNPQFSAPGVVGNMDFLAGISQAAGMPFYKVGNGSWDTNYDLKGKQTLTMLEEGHDFVYCHINAPDEAAHSGELDKKIFSIEQIDLHIVLPVLKYFNEYPDRLGGICIMPDHYTNTISAVKGHQRNQSHTAHPVPFAIWNNQSMDRSKAFTEKESSYGVWGSSPLNHLRLLSMLGNIVPVNV
jgi:2,3-bisphosphoglycerate-independent phosphoglycerate mutase